MKEIEIIEKRKLREKHFLQEDGTIVAKVYNNNIHYKKNGKYEEIDNTLIKENNYFSNKSNDYKVLYKDNGNDSLIKMIKDEYYINISLKESKQTILDIDKNLTNRITYRDILEGIDIVYKNLPTKVKETVVLKNKIYDKLTFEIDTNLELKIENGHILALKDDNIIFTIDKPYMEDSNKKFNNNIYYVLRKEVNKIELDLVLDVEWLKSKDTIFPVYIDPTITNASQAIDLQDTYIYPGDTGVNKGNQDILKAGVERVNGTDIVNRALIKFSLPEIGTGSEIVGAYLILTGYPVVTQLDNKLVTMHRMTQDWTESEANWETLNNKFDERVESIYYGGRSYLNGPSIEPEHGYYNGDITNLVKKWYRDTDNFGIMLKSAREEYIDEQYPAFCSKNYNDGISDAAYNPMPIFQLVYRNMNGLESYLDFLTQSFTDGSTFVNTYTGNMTGVFDIGHTISGKFPVSLSLIYNTNDVVLNNTTVFGKGYKLSLNQTIEVVTIGGNEYLEYKDEDGTLHYFVKDAIVTPETYYDEDGLSLTIEKTDTICTMTDKNGGKMKFNKNSNKYYLTEIRDVRDNVIGIVLDSNNNITKIVDANNAEINFVYNQNEIQVISPDSTTYLKYSNGILNSIESVNGTTNFTYNSNSIIDTITDVNGLKINYEYCSQKPYRIKKVTQYGLNNVIGNYFSLSYGFNTTTIVDHREKVQTLVFNNQGNLLSINSLNSSEDVRGAYAITRNYGNDNSNKNKLLSDSIPTKYIKNYLKNSSFETDIDYFTKCTGVIKSFSADCSVTGNRSLKITCDSNSPTHSISMDLTDLPRGRHYTFSAYFKADAKAKLTLSYPSATMYDSSRSQTSDIEVSDKFVRKDITVYYDEGIQAPLNINIELKSGTLYIDDMQLEEGEVASSYNIIENSDFSSGLSDWNLATWGYDGLEATDVNQVFSVVKINGGRDTALKVAMNPLQGSRFSKEFPIKGKKGDLYNVSFWYKNEGIPAEGNIVANNVAIYFKPVGAEADYCILPSKDLNHDENVWQYFTFRYGADEDYEAIRLLFNQGRESNNFFITNLTFYKDLSNNYYDYDKNGNVTNIRESSKESGNIFEYDDNNQLISAMTPRGKNFKLEYDNVKTDRVLNAISSMGISNQVKYDTYGNPISTRISKKNTDEIITGKYRIRSKGTDKYIKARYRNIFVESDACSNTIWKVEKIEEDYRIVFDTLQNYSILATDNTVVLAPNVQDNVFVLEKKENGSYYIKLKPENPNQPELDENGNLTSKCLKVNGSTIEIATKEYNNPAFEFYFETIDEEFIENSATYTEDGRFVASVTDSNFNTTLYEINSTTGLITSQNDAKNNVTSYTYNNKKQIASVTQKDKIVNYTYNDKNLLSKIKQGNREYNFIYDDFLNMKKVTIGDNITLAVNEYEENNGNLSSTTYGNGDIISYEYDEFNRIKSVLRMDEHYHYRYDSNGNLAKISTNNPVMPYDLAMK